MKKRLSLLMVLMMVLSLVPMSVFATAGSVPGGLISVDDTETTTTPKTAVVKLTQSAGSQIVPGGQVRLTLNKGEFDTTISDARFAFAAGGTTTEAAGTIVRNGAFKSEAYLTIPNQAALVATGMGSMAGSKFLVEKDDMDILLTLPLTFDEESVGDITLSVEEVDASGLDVAKPIVIGTVKEGTGDDMKLSVTDATKKIGFDGGTLSKFSVKDIDEVAGANYIELELPDYLNWSFPTTGDKTLLTIGNTNITPAAGATPAASEYVFDGKNKLIINVTGFQKQQLNIEPVVEVIRKDASTGDITVKVTARGTVSGSSLEKIDGVIGVVADYDVVMTAKEKGKKEIPAMYGGDEATVRVKLAGVVGSFTEGRTIDFKIEGADIVTSMKDKDTATDGVSVSVANGKVVLTDAEADKKIVKDGEFTLKMNQKSVKDFEFDLKIKADYAQSGAVKLTADSRDFGKIEAEIAKVTPAYTVETKVTSIKKGETLATSDIVIKEAKAGLLDTDAFIVLNLNDKNRDTLNFSKGYKVEATNGMKVKDELFDESAGTRRGLNTLVLEVETSSTKEAATITIKDVMVSVDGSTVDGTKVLATNVVKNDDLASGKTKDRAEAVRYVFASTTDYKDAQDPNYEIDYVNVVKEYGSVATTTVFKIGSKEYTVNGEAKTANEAPYVSGKGYTMLPVRAVGEALGLKADWNSATKTATFANDSKVASVVVGSDVMYVNGTPVKLSAKAEIKNGSTFVELRGLASAFMVELEWDAATKSVTIKG